MSAKIRMFNAFYKYFSLENKKGELFKYYSEECSDFDVMDISVLNAAKSSLDFETITPKNFENITQEDVVLLKSPLQFAFIKIEKAAGE